MAGDNVTIEMLVEEWAPLLARAFLDAIYATRDGVQITLLIEMLERGDIDGALRAVGIDPVAFRALDVGIAQAFEDGGKLTTGQIPATRDPDGFLLKVRFDVRNYEAERWLREFGADLVKEIEQDTRELVRQRIVDGMEKGENPRTVALDLTGRVNPVTGRREGGLIGLTASQAKWVISYEARLRSGDPAQMREALSMGLRDKRYDATVERAIREGKPIPPEKIDKMVTAYRNRALRYRAESIGRTEALSALHEAQVQGWRQAIAKGQVKVETLTKTWRSAMDERVRHTHIALNGQTVGFDEAFESPSGAFLRYPHDPQAPTAETVMCRCHMDVKIDFLRGIR